MWRHAEGTVGREPLRDALQPECNRRRRGQAVVEQIDSGGNGDTRKEAGFVEQFPSSPLRRFVRDSGGIRNGRTRAAIVTSPSIWARSRARHHHTGDQIKDEVYKSSALPQT